jgi:CHAT domain-containing protein/tetratricopeptide (TPR) repeat protein
LITIHSDLDDYKSALGYVEQLVDLKREMGKPRDVAILLNVIGEFYDHWGDSNNALNYHNQALKLFQSERDGPGEGETLRLIGTAYYDLGDRQKALEFDSKALSFAKDIPDRELEAVTLNDIGNVYNAFGERKKALDAYERALSLHRTNKNRRGEAVTLGNIGWLYEEEHEYYKALSYLDRALTLKRELGNTRGEGYTLRLIGNVYIALGEYQKSLDYLEPALHIMRTVDDKDGEALTLCSLASAYGQLGSLERELDYYQRSLLIYQTNHNRWGESDTLSNIGSVFLDRGDNLKALQYFNEALIVERELRNRKSEASELTSIGAIYAYLGDDQRALNYLNKARSLHHAINYRGCEACTLSTIGWIYDRQGQQSHNSKYLLKALKYYHLAIEANEHIRTVARLEEFKTKLEERSSDIYRRAIALHTQFGQYTKAFELSERARARTFLDQIGNSRLNVRTGADAKLIEREQDLRSTLIALQKDLMTERIKTQPQLSDTKIDSLEKTILNVQQQYENTLTDLKIRNPEYAALRSVNPLKLTKVQKLLNTDTTLLSYVVLQDSIAVFVITHHSFNMVELPVSEKQLENKITWFRHFSSLRNPKPESLVQLYKSLIAPIRPFVKTPLVGIIPTGVLHYLPFAALTDGTAFWGDEYAIFYLPSASVLPFISGKKQLDNNSILPLAQGRAAGLPTLQYADQEAQRIAQLYDTEALITPTATKSAFLTRAGQYNILHIAAHGQLNNVHPLFSRVLLAPSGENDDGSVAVADVYGLTLPKTSLAVLSACETQLGPRSKGDDIIGLNRAFIYAGAPSVMASLWSVDDESTSVLMEAFYTHLRQGDHKARALQAAQRETRARYPHPYYWAAFVLTGDPGINAVKTNRGYTGH